MNNELSFMGFLLKKLLDYSLNTTLRDLTGCAFKPVRRPVVFSLLNSPGGGPDAGIVNLPPIG